MSMGSETICYATAGPTADLLDGTCALSDATDGGWPSGRRVLDVACALFLLLVTAPFLVVALIVTRLTSRGPAIYTQVRVGLNGRPFMIYKVRTMRHECERQSGARWCVPGDSRVTRIGRFLRKTKIDELPQLWNILKGEMSLVGPRPERPEFVPQLARVFPAYRDRLLVPPGLTGLAQVQLAADTDLESVRAKLACDLCYLRHASASLNVRIILATPLYLLGVSFPVTRCLLGLPETVVGEPAQQVSAAPLGLPVQEQVA